MKKKVAASIREVKSITPADIEHRVFYPGLSEQGLRQDSEAATINELKDQSK